MLVTGDLALVYLFFFAYFKCEEKLWKVALAKINYFGTFLFIGSVIALLLGLVIRGVVYPWGSAIILVPIVAGLLSIL